MQHFHEEKILSTYNTKASKKRRQQGFKAHQLLESFQSLRDTEEIIENKKEQAIKEGFYNTVNNKHKLDNKYKDNYEVHQKTDYINEQIDNIVRDLFFYTVYESLLVDDIIKNENFQYIRKHTNEFYDLCNEKNALTIKENSGFEDIVNTAICNLKEELINHNSCDLNRVIKSTILDESLLMNFAIDAIKLKTADSLRNEKQSAIIKEHLINEERYVDTSKSLFRNLFEKNIKETIDNTNITDPENLQDMAMVETILDYTILESANTLQLVQFHNLKTYCNR